MIAATHTPRLAARLRQHLAYCHRPARQNRLTPQHIILAQCGAFGVVGRMHLDFAGLRVNHPPQAGMIAAGWVHNLNLPVYHFKGLFVIQFHPTLHREQGGSVHIASCTD
jgi:hypothetical protein